MERAPNSSVTFAAHSWPFPFISFVSQSARPHSRQELRSQAQTKMTNQVVAVTISNLVSAPSQCFFRFHCHNEKRTRRKRPYVCTILYCVRRPRDVKRYYLLSFTFFLVSFALSVLIYTYSYIHFFKKKKVQMG